MSYAFYLYNFFRMFTTFQRKVLFEIDSVSNNFSIQFIVVWTYYVHGWCWNLMIDLTIYLFQTMMIRSLGTDWLIVETLQLDLYDMNQIWIAFHTMKRPLYLGCCQTNENFNARSIFRKMRLLLSQIIIYNIVIL